MKTNKRRNGLPSSSPIHGGRKGEASSLDFLLPPACQTTLRVCRFKSPREGWSVTYPRHELVRADRMAL